MDPTASSIPSMTGGAGGAAGPSTANGSFFSSFGGMDGSGWAVNFNGANGATATVAANKQSVATPAQVGFTADQFGLPNMVTSTPAVSSGSSTSSMGVSPLLIVAVLVVVLALRHRK